MKKRVTSGWVTVIGPPRLIWARKASSALPIALERAMRSLRVMVP